MITVKEVNVQVWRCSPSPVFAVPELCQYLIGWTRPEISLPVVRFDIERGGVQGVAAFSDWSIHAHTAFTALLLEAEDESLWDLSLGDVE